MSLADLFSVPQVEPSNVRIVNNWTKYDTVWQKAPKVKVKPANPKVPDDWMDFLPGTAFELAEKCGCGHRNMRYHIARAVKDGAIKPIRDIPSKPKGTCGRFRVWGRA